MRLPIDTGTLKFVAAAPAEPDVDYETRAEISGQKSFGIIVFSSNARAHSVIGAPS